MNTTETPYVGKHRDESVHAHDTAAIREYRHSWFGTEYVPRHNATHRPAAVVSHLTLALTAEGTNR